MAIESKDVEISELRKEIVEIRTSSNVKYDALVKEMNLVQENVKAGKKLCEFYVSDNKNLQNKLEQAEKEIGMLRNEIELLEGEGKRMEEENVFFFN